MTVWAMVSRARYRDTKGFYSWYALVLTKRKIMTTVNSIMRRRFVVKLPFYFAFTHEEIVEYFIGRMTEFNEPMRWEEFEPCFLDIVYKTMDMLVKAYNEGRDRRGARKLIDSLLFFVEEVYSKKYDCERAKCDDYSQYGIFTCRVSSYAIRNVKRIMEEGKVVYREGDCAWYRWETRGSVYYLRINERDSWIIWALRVNKRCVEADMHDITVIDEIEKSRDIPEAVKRAILEDVRRLPEDVVLMLISHMI